MRFLPCLVVLVLPALVRAEQVDNPRYKMWAAYKAGATTTHAMEANMQGQAMKLRMTITLKEVTADKAVLRNETVIMMNGQEMAAPAEEEAVPARIEASKVDPSYAATEKADVEKGSETLEVSGKKLECKWYKFTDKVQKTNGKVWMCDQVPGGMVKFDGETDGQTMKIMLQSFKADLK